MAHKNNKNNKDNKKVNPKTKSEMRDMEVEMSKEIGANNESKKLGKNESAREKRR
ncbi:small, acid-soluble spore protein, alpha/beta type [Haloimpatiens lingqiaonensis]|uniref:small, acid-soluble spore protein, alpha/beta type n=1 Tax=Haloimpatiens lingqiaonensis TaxID=1380675 RepID=UPI0010FF4997|nr:small, acid-soluble spore protein, alpha/beta type [Haloimpatiens lingqiaonensis]